MTLAASIGLLATQETPSTSITPGLAGFFSLAFMAVALWLLMRNMNARMRRMSYRQRDAGRGGTEAQAVDVPNEADAPSSGDGHGDGNSSGGGEGGA